MERRVAESSYFLPPYDSRASTATVEQLKVGVANAIAELLPRKKFSFSKKKKEAATPKQPAAAATAASGAASAEGSAAAAAADEAAAALKKSALDDGPGMRSLSGGTYVAGRCKLTLA